VHAHYAARSIRYANELRRQEAREERRQAEIKARITLPVVNLPDFD
jgi:hypothetical protein